MPYVPKFRTKSSVDAFENFLITRVEKTLEHGALPLIVLKLLSKRAMSGSEIRRAISHVGFSRPTQPTFYTTLALLHAMKMIEIVKTGPSRQKTYAITEKGKQVLSRAEKHLKTLTTKILSL